MLQCNQGTLYFSCSVVKQLQTYTCSGAGDESSTIKVLHSRQEGHFSATFSLTLSHTASLSPDCFSLCQGEKARPRQGLHEAQSAYMLHSLQCLSLVSTTSPTSQADSLHWQTAYSFLGSCGTPWVSCLPEPSLAIYTSPASSGKFFTPGFLHVRPSST